MSEPSSTTTGGGFGRALASIGRFLFRLVLVLLIGALLGGLIFFGITSLYTRFILPQQALSERVNNLETRQASSRSGLETRVAEISGRVAYLEGSYPEKLENLSSLEGQAQRLQAASDARQKQMATLQADLESLKASTWHNATQVAGMEAERLGSDAPLAALQRDLQVLKALELLNRARLYMVESNFGLAVDDVRAARDVIARLQQDAPELQQKTLLDWTQRLERTIQDLPGSPVTAANNLEQTWALMAAGLPAQPGSTALEGQKATPTPSATPFAGTTTPQP